MQVAKRDPLYVCTLVNEKGHVEGVGEMVKGILYLKDLYNTIKYTVNIHTYRKCIQYIARIRMYAYIACDEGEHHKSATYLCCMQ